MLKDIITYINSFLDVAKTFELVELYRKANGSIHPAEYCNSGEYKNIDFDKYKHLIYHRLNGSVLRVETEEFGCADAITETYPMKAILYCPKDCDTDNAYSNLSKANELANDIKNVDLNALRKANKLLDLKVTLGDTNIDSFNVWALEFDNVNPRRESSDYRLPSTHMMVSIDYTITLIGTPACLATSANTTHIFKFCGINDTLESDPEYCFIDTLA